MEGSKKELFSWDSGVKLLPCVWEVHADGVSVFCRSVSYPVDLCILNASDPSFRPSTVPFLICSSGLLLHLWFVRCFFAKAYTSYLQRLEWSDGRTCVCVHFTVLVCVCVQLYIVNCALYTAGCVLQTLALAGFCDWRFSCFLSVLM